MGEVKAFFSAAPEYVMDEEMSEEELEKDEEQ